MTTPLPNCPHCKGEADVYRKTHPTEHAWSVCCKTCWAGTAEYPTEAEARAAWARRDELDTLAAQVQRAVDEASRQADRAVKAESKVADLETALRLAREARPDTRELVEALENTLDALERQRAGFPLEAEHYYAIRDGALAALRAQQEGE